MIVKRLPLLLPVFAALLSVAACKDTTGSQPEVKPRSPVHNETASSADSTRRGPGLFGGGS